MRKLHFFQTYSLLLSLILVSTGCENNRWIRISGKKYPSFSISGGKMKLPVTIGNNSNAGSIFFFTKSDTFFIEDKPEVTDEKEGILKASWNNGGRKISVSFSNLADTVSFEFNAGPDEDIMGWGMNIAATRDEYFTGLFERVVDGNQTESWRKGITEAMNLRGQEIDMIIKPTLSLYCPFYLSSNGYGLFIDGTMPGHYDFCKKDPGMVKITFEGKSMRGRFYTSGNPADIVKAHASFTGPTIIPPSWAFLPWRWRDNHTNNKTYYDGTPVNAPYNSMLVEDILMMKALDIPCGVYWVDRPWAKGMHGYEDFEWDPVRFPAAEKMIQWLHENNTRFLLWIAPWVTGDMRTEAYQKGYAQKVIKNHPPLDTSNVALLDFTNPEACRWWQENGIEKMLKQGVDGFKLDRSEELPVESDTVFLFDGRSTREVRNEYPVLYVKTVNESCRKIHGDDFMLLPRAGYAGSSRYGGFWGGDIGSPEEGLRTAIIAAQRSAIIGYPIWGSDIGGYWQGELDREVCARWLAFGCFNPVMEFGPTEDHAPWDMQKAPHYDTALIAVWRLYAKIHESLVNYTYDLVKEAHSTGMPVIRPLFLEYPGEEASWKNWENFTYGPDILIAAIWQKGITKLNVHLPSGTQWSDAWDKSKVYEGGSDVEVNCPFHKIPIFIRKGSELNLGNLQELYDESFTIASLKPDLVKLDKQAR